MAFICDWCREHVLENNGSGAMKSHGVCELCETLDICTDVRHYQCKKDWQNILKNQTDWTT